MLSINKQNLMIWSAYTAFFFACFTLFAYFTFPYERVRDLLVTKASSVGAPGTKLSIGALGPHWLTGIALTSVKLERGKGATGEPASPITLDKVTVRASPLALLFGNLGLHFSAE